MIMSTVMFCLNDKKKTKQNIFQPFVVKHSCAPDYRTEAAPATGENTLLLWMMTLCIINAVSKASQWILIFSSDTIRSFFNHLNFKMHQLNTIISGGQRINPADIILLLGFHKSHPLSDCFIFIFFFDFE